MTTEFKLIFTGQTEANTLGWINEYRSHPRDATRLVLPAEDFFAQMAAQYPATPPVDPPQPPSGVYVQADLQFNGARYDTSGVSGSTVACMRITVPSPLPDGWLGKTSSVSVFENGNGTIWRHATLSRTAGDMSPLPPAAAGSTGPNLYLCFGKTAPSAVTVQAGEVWYLNVKAELWTAAEGGNQPSVGPGGNANFGVKLYPPGA